MLEIIQRHECDSKNEIQQPRREVENIVFSSSVPSFGNGAASSAPEQGLRKAFSGSAVLAFGNSNRMFRSSEILQFSEVRPDVSFNLAQRRTSSVGSQWSDTLSETLGAKGSVDVVCAFEEGPGRVEVQCCISTHLKALICKAEYINILSTWCIVLSGLCWVIPGSCFNFTSHL